MQSENRETLNDFLKSDTEKIYLVTGADERVRYRFMADYLDAAAANENHRVYRYEIGSGEHSRHFLLRWLYETVHGLAAVGRTAAVEVDDRRRDQLQLLIEKDIRPLEIRFIEAVRFLSQNIAGDQRMVLAVVIRTCLRDRTMVDFFRSVIKVLPVHVKMVIAIQADDVLALQTDFCPSNRVVLESGGTDSAAVLSQTAEAASDSGTKGRVVQALGRLMHPADVDLLAAVAECAAADVDSIMASLLENGVLEKAPEAQFRLVCPIHMETLVSAIPAKGEAVDKAAVVFLEARMAHSRRFYPDALYHSLALSRLTDLTFVSDHTLTAYPMKAKIGGGDLCEYEFDRVLSLTPEDQTGLQARFLLKLGEIREGRQRNAEALEVLNPAIERLQTLGQPEDLQRAYELKGRAAFQIRDTDTAREALEASLAVAREMRRDDLTADLTSQLGYLHYSLQKLAEAEALYQAALKIYQDLSRSGHAAGASGEAAQWSNLGHTAYAKGDFAQAETRHKKSLELYTALEKEDAAARQWGYLGHTYFGAHEFEKAIDAYEKAAEIEEKTGRLHQAAQRYANVGHTLYAQRKVDLAERSFAKALEKYRLFGNPEGEAAQLSNLGMVKGDAGEFEAALDYFEQAAQLYLDLGDEISHAGQTVKMGHVRRAQKQYDSAIECYQGALSRFQNLKYVMGEANVEIDLGQLYTEKQDSDSAVARFTRAIELFRKLGHKEKEAFCHALIGNTEQARKNVKASLAAYENAVEVYAGAGIDLGVANVSSQMGLLQYENKNYGEAEQLYRKALQIFREKEDAEGEATLLSNLGTLYFQTGEFDNARSELEKALELLRRMGHPLGLASVLQNLSFIYEKGREFNKAYECLRESRDIFQKMELEKETAEIEERLAALDQQAARSLGRMRAELFPGLGQAPAAGEAEDFQKVGRNDPCPCGSGKKFKKCCGS